jgi:alpha/beta superfamily hydrolase
MPEVIFPGPEGRLEGRFHPGLRPRAPVALILHSHPQAGGTMNNKIVQLLYQTFVKRGFATLRFNFRGVGKSQGVFDNGIGELSDAASALDWVQQIHPEASSPSRRPPTCTTSASLPPAPRRASSSRARRTRW